MDKFSPKARGVLLILILIDASIRGIYEILFPKDLAIFIQVIIALILGSIIIDKKKLLKNKKLLIISTFTIFIALISIYQTYYNIGIIGFNFIFLILFSIYYIYVGDNLKNYSIDSYFFDNLLKLLFIIIIYVAIMQQVDKFYLEYFPGRTEGYKLARPTSLTGSYLHYPLIISIMTILFLENYKNTNVINLLFIIMGLLSSIISQSRYAILSLGIYFILKFLFKEIRLTKLSILLFSILSSIIISIPILGARILSIFNLSSDGNPGRIDSWMTSISYLNIENIFYGTNFGIYSNSYRGNYNRVIFVPESSLLLLSLSLGFIGALLYYCLIFFNFNSLNKKYIPLLSIMIPTLFYQSVEVIPFIIFISLFPFLSYQHSLAKR